MGILQTAYNTYESYAHLAGEGEEGREALLPVSHMVQNAQIEVVLSEKGSFRNALNVDKKEAKTIIPATMKSSTCSGNVAPHPLCEQLFYLMPYEEAKFSAFMKQLEDWATSGFSHPKVCAVLNYMKSRSLLSDLVQLGIVTVNDQGELDSKYSKYLVRWRVMPSDESVKSACWEDKELFDKYTKYYELQCSNFEKDLCMITGEQDIVCDKHPKGVVAASFGAKIISANDDVGFTYRGRFTQANEAYSVGYKASQKAHHALRFVSANSGVIMGGRTFVCWNPKGKEVLVNALFGYLPREETEDFISYKKELQETLKGYKQSLKDADDVVITAFDAATTGRLSVTYYSEQKAHDFLKRIENWYEGCCWISYNKVQSPPLKRIIECAFGVQRKFIEADDRVLKEHIQRLIPCVIEGKPIPFDIVHALTAKASTPLAYTTGNRETVLLTACAVLKKYRNHRFKEEEWSLGLDLENKDRSYLFGRLLAVAEYLEKSTYDQGEGKETNAIRMQSVFSQRPKYAWGIISGKLIPYYVKLTPGERAMLEKLIDEIEGKIDASNPDLNKPLDAIYLFGYSHQRGEFYKKKITNNEEVIENDEQ